MKKFFCKCKKKVALLATTMALTVGTAMTALAAEDSTGTADILSESLGTVKSDIMSFIFVVLPIGLGIFGAIFGIRKAISFFRSVAK